MDVATHLKKVHLRIKNHSCGQCDKQFSKRWPLMEHETAIHDKLRPLACVECEFQCAKLENLNQHRKNNHGLMRINLSIAKYEELILKVRKTKNIDLIKTIKIYS